MTLEISYHKKCDYDYIDIQDVKSIYPLDDRYKEKKKEYKELKEKAEALEKLLSQRSLFERERQ